MLNKESILKAPDSKIDEVAVPEWGGSVFVRALPGAELDDFEAENYQVNTKGEVTLNRRNMRARLLVRAICDDSGNPMFTLKDVDALSKKSGTALNRVFQAAQKLNGLGSDDIDGAVKNSERGDGDSSASPSPVS